MSHSARVLTTADDELFELGRQILVSVSQVNGDRRYQRVSRTLDRESGVTILDLSSFPAASAGAVSHAR
jgi:hypothetical protein